MPPKDTTTSFKNIPPFFKPDAPPPTLPIPIAQVEVGRIHAIRLLAQEELGPNPKHFQSFVKNRSPSVISRKKVVIDDPLSDSDSQADSSSTTDSDSDSGLIPKPEGEAGRPGRGGYNLEDTLAWSKEEYRQLKVWFSLACALWPYSSVHSFYREGSRNLSKNS